MRAFVYCRVSTEEQSTEDHYSLEYQEEKARHRVKEKGWRLVKLRKDVGSGKDSERAGYQELLRDVTAGNVDVVIVYKLDRLSRNVKDIYHFLDLIRESNVGFVSLTEGFDTTTPMGRAMLGIAAVFAQLTRETIAENTKNGMLQRAKRGKWTGSGLPPYGYVYEKGNGLVVEPVEAETVKRIFRLFVDQKLSASRIARMLNTEKVPTKTGAEWSTSLVSRLLKNPVAIGKVSFGEEVYSGSHPAIVDEEAYEAAQAMLNSRAKVHHRTLTSKFLLSGVARCGHCGCLMQTRHKDENQKFYVCRGNEKVNSPKACSGVAKSAKALDSLVIDRIREVAQSGAIQEMALEEAKRLLEVETMPYQDEKDRLAVELQDMADAFTKWADRLDRGLIDEEQFNMQNARLMARKKKAQSRIEELEEVLSRQERARADFEAVKAALADFDRLWDAATLEEKQEVVRLLVEKLEVLRGQVIMKLRFGPEETVALPKKAGMNSEVHTRSRRCQCVPAVSLRTLPSSVPPSA